MTHVGRIRKNNEDAFLGMAFNAEEVSYLGKIGEADLIGRDFIFAVSDGMGGEKSGEFASKITLEKLTRAMPKAYQAQADGPRQGYADTLSSIIGAIHTELGVLSRYYEECRNMGATLTLVWLCPGWLHYAHIGDSRLYFSGQHFEQLTTDHSYPGYLRKQGQINEREHRTHPRRNALLRALGAGGQFATADFGCRIWNSGDRLLLCTDGLTDGMWDARIQDFLTQPENLAGPTLAQRMVDYSVEESGRDNTTALIISLT
jgi:protein phosphatase